MKFLLCGCAGLIVAMCGAIVHAQDEGAAARPEAARRLYLWNDSDQPTLFTLERPSRSYTTSTVNVGDSRTIPLLSTKDDRVLIASKPGNTSGTFAMPYRVFATSHFNASMHPSSTIGAALIGSKEDGYDIIYWAREGNEIKPLVDEEGSRRFIEQNKEQINQAMERAKEEAVGQ